MNATKEILELITKEQLIEFVEHICSQDMRVKQEFLSRYQLKSAENSKASYKSSLSYYNNIISNDSYMDYRDARYFGNSLDELLNMAKNRIDAKDFISAVNAICVVLEEGTLAINNCDDSGGYVGGAIYCGIDLLMDITNEDLENRVKKYIYDYCISSYKSMIFKGWDWHLSMLKIAFNISNSVEDIECIEFFIDSELNIKDAYWNKTALLELKFNIINKLRGDDVAREFMYNHLDIELFRRRLIEYNISLNNLKEAKRIATDGVESEYYVTTWRELLLKIALIEHDKIEVVRQAELLMISSYHNEDIKNYFMIIKKMINVPQWNEFKGRLINYFSNKCGVIPHILVLAEIEKDWELYFEHVSKSTSYNYIIDAENTLPVEYKTKLAMLYCGLIKKKMEQNLGRSYYIEAVCYIKRIISLGEKEMAYELIKYLRCTYKRRPALIDELKNFSLN